jgi:hypothetical protein
LLCHALRYAALGAAQASKPSPVKLLALAGTSAAAAAGSASFSAAFAGLAAAWPTALVLALGAGSEALARISVISPGSVPYVAVTSIPWLTAVIRWAIGSSAADAAAARPRAGCTRTASVVPSRSAGQSWLLPGSPR